jgi:hypothetical protein
MEKINFKKSVELINQSIDEAKQTINYLVNYIEEGYVLVQWPESQKFMEEDWFEDEAILASENEIGIGSSAYFIPIKRLYF